MAISVGIVGAAGFAGIELVRLVLRHPSFDLMAVTSTELSGRRLDEAYPAFAGQCDLAFSPHDADDLQACDVVFLAVPHTAALTFAPALIARGATVIDLSADFRLKDPAIYEEWYRVPHTEPELLARAAFGLPELFGEELAALAQRRSAGEGVLVACAGCYPTATSLAAAPVLRAGLSPAGLVVVDAVSGVTGAGRKATERTHFCFANEGVEAYGVGSHRHTPEIEQILGLEGRLIFTPHLAPYNRGLLSTVTMPVTRGAFDQAELAEMYRSFFKGAPFVTVLPKGRQPRTASVAGTNYAHVSACYNERAGAVVATCAIDNIGKGAAGQAVQCANIVCGLPETCGLDAVALPI